MRNKLINSMKFGESLDLMYVANSGVISKRRVKVIQIGEDRFQAYCFLRKSKRTFKIENVLALVPVFKYENMVI